MTDSFTSPHADETRPLDQENADPVEVASSINETPSAPAETDPHWKRRVTLFLIAQAISLFGSSIVQYAIMWYLTLTLKTGWVITLYAVVAFVPQAILSLFGGTLADRMNRRTVIAVSDSIIALVTLGLAVAMIAGETSLWLIYGAVFIRSVGAGFQQPAVGALLPQLTPTSQLMRVNGINQTINSAMALLSPVIAGAVYGWGGLVPTFWIDVVTALIGVGIVLTIPVATVRSGGEDRKSFAHDLMDGLRYVAGHRTILWLMVLYTVIFTLIVAPNFMVPLMIARDFTDAVWPLTVMETSFSAGMALGGLAIATFAVKWNQSRMLLYSCGSFGLLSAALGLTPFLGTTVGLFALFVLMFIIALLIPFFSAPVMTLVQTTVEQTYMGRVFSLINIVAVLGMPIGMIAFGPLADRFSIQWIFIISGIIAFGFTVVSFMAEPGREVLKMSGQPATRNPQPSVTDTDTVTA